ncbi:MAG: hypothetical protein ABIG95_03950 [Candidatus Woesearchaeota archaeon]
MKKAAPWGKIGKGDTVYFKNSGEPVALKASVSGVMQFADLDQKKVKDILEKYGRSDGLGIEDIHKYFELFKNKKYCILVLLNNVEKIKPFEIDKTGFGAMAAWLCVDNITKIRKDI